MEFHTFVMIVCANAVVIVCVTESVGHSSSTFIAAIIVRACNGDKAHFA